MNTQRDAHTDDAAYDLFRRAIEERDADAWSIITHRYRLLLISWAAQFSAKTPISEPCEDIADQALARAWTALLPNRLGSFPCIAALLGYLRTCVMAVVIDHTRAIAARERIRHKLEAEIVETPEEIIVDRSERIALWQLLNRLITNQQERTILIESYVFDLPPRAIWARHTDLFPDIADVYSTKRNLLNRLQRSRALQELCQDIIAT